MLCFASPVTPSPPATIHPNSHDISPPLLIGLGLENTNFPFQEDPSSQKQHEIILLSLYDMTPVLFLFQDRSSPTVTYYSSSAFPEHLQEVLLLMVKKR